MNVFINKASVNILLFQKSKTKMGYFKRERKHREILRVNVCKNLSWILCGKFCSCYFQLLVSMSFKNFNAVHPYESSESNAYDCDDEVEEDLDEDDKEIGIKCFWNLFSRNLFLILFFPLGILNYKGHFCPNK